MSFGEKGCNYKIQPIYSMSNKPELMLMTFYTLIIAGLFYSMGNFGFLNIFGIRREVQIIFILGLLLIGPLIYANLPRLLTKPIFLLALACFFTEIILRQRSVDILDRLTTILVIGILLSVSKEYRDKTLRIIIVMAAIFSIMAIVQAIIIIFKPGLILLVAGDYTSMSEAAKLEILNPIGILGFNTAEEVNFFGHDFTRFRSFGSEPSVLVYSFLVPGILALSYKGYIRLLAIPILFFSIFLAQAGTIWLSISLGIMAWGLLYLFKRRVFLLSVLPFLLIIVGLIVLSRMDISSFIINMMEKFVSSLPEYYSVLNKTRSAIFRFEDMRNAFTISQKYFLGTPFVSELSGTGLLIGLTLSAGLIGLILGIILFYYIFKLITRCFKLNRGTVRLMAALLYGTFIQVLSFSSYGWNRFAGFLLLALIINRLEILVSETKCVTKTKIY